MVLSCFRIIASFHQSWILSAGMIKFSMDWRMKKSTSDFRPERQKSLVDKIGGSLYEIRLWRLCFAVTERYS